MHFHCPPFSFAMTRQRRGACQPGATPRGRVRVHVPPCKGGPIDSETEGVALGWSAAALSVPESKLCKSEFTSLDGWPFMSRLLKNSRAAFCKRLSRQFNIQLVQIGGLKVREPLRGIEESIGFLG